VIIIIAGYPCLVSNNPSLYPFPGRKRKKKEPASSKLSMKTPLLIQH